MRDIFNEGIDIPCLNQVIMMRQTESSIVFVQQLGRGLRKFKDKEYLVVIDFIGNYQNNFMIPMALADDHSLSKDSIRKQIIDPGFLSGISHISFEEVARKRILNSIATQNLDDLRTIREAYQYLKAKIGRQPQLIDFIEYNSIDPLIIVDKFRSYTDFISRMENVPQPVSDPYADAVLQCIFKEFTNGKRMHELLLLKALLREGSLSREAYIRLLRAQQLDAGQVTLTSVERILDYRFFVEADRQRYGSLGPVKLRGEYYCLNESIYQHARESESYRLQIEDIIAVARAKNSCFQPGRQLTPFKKYSRKDVCRLLNWENDEKGTIYGYKLKHNTLPIFITYNKSADHNSHVHYSDELLDPNTIYWYTRANRTTNSKEIKELLHSQAEGSAVIHVFMKKDDDEGASFYYLGTARIDDKTIQDEVVQTQKGDQQKNIVSMNLLLDQSIELSLYHHLTE